MSRIRTIKPEFWSAEQIIECSVNARCAFIGLWNFCDDHGRRTTSHGQIKAQIFPGDNFTKSDIAKMLDELERNGLITFYSNNNRELLQVNGWRHQKINRPQKALYPGPFDEGSVIIHGSFTDRSLLEKEKEKEKEKKEYGSFERTSTTSIACSIQERFEKWWLTYPRRVGTNPKKPAREKYLRLAKAGEDLDAIEAATKAYASGFQGPSQFVQRATTFLNQETWKDESLKLADPAADPMAAHVAHWQSQGLSEEKIKLLKESISRNGRNN